MALTSAELARLEVSEENQGANALIKAINEGQNIYGMTDGYFDVFTDETGVDTVTSTEERYDAYSDYYSPDSTATAAGTDFVDRSPQNATITTVANTSTIIPTGTYTDNGTKFNDVSGNNVNVETVSSVTTHIPTGSGGDEDPYGGTEPVFDLVQSGASGIRCYDSNNWTFGSNGVGDWSMAFWVKTTDTTAKQFCSHYTSSGNQRSWYLYFNLTSSGSVDWRSFTTGNSSPFDTLSTAGSQLATDDSWNYVVLTYTSSTSEGTIYINGVQKAQSTLDAPFNPNGTAYFIAGQAGTSKFSEVRVFDTVISATTPTSRPDADADTTLYLDHVKDTDPYGGTGAVMETTTTSGGVTAPDDANWTYGANGIGDWSCAFWMRTDSTSNQTLFQHYDSTGNQRSWYVLLNNAVQGEIKWYTFSSGTSSPVATLASARDIITTNTEWNYVVMTYTGTTATIYVKGVQVAQDTSFAGCYNPTSAVPLGVGKSDVDIVDFRMFDTVISPTVPETSPDRDANTTVYLKSLEDNAPNVSLLGSSQTAQSVPTNARLVVVHTPVDSVTLDTDAVLSISRDGGTTFTNFTLTKKIDYGTIDGETAEILVTNDLDISAQPSGTSMVWKLTTANAKEQRLNAVYAQWR
jgi:hypothetical protein